MPTELEKKFPNITKWIKGDGWIEVGSSSYEGGMAKAFDEGGCVFEGKSKYSSLDAILKDIDRGIAQWCSENGIDLDE